MNCDGQKIAGVATNIITGFLGAGKTTAILHLLKQKPAGERWAVLVNEFGEVGIDGSMYSGQSNSSGVFIREVPGGCMCCAAALPMQVALNQLLVKAKPDRLLIEPTGLGHPEEVLAVLAGNHYRDVLELNATIALVDARKIQYPRYSSHAIFQQQLRVADLIVANKADQYGINDFSVLVDYLKNTLDLDTPVVQCSQGALKVEWLNASTARHALDHHHHHHHHHHPHHHRGADNTIHEHAGWVIPEQGYLSIDNKGEDYYSRGWIFKPEWVFDADKLRALLSQVKPERLKGAFITDRGFIAYNKSENAVSEAVLDRCNDSRIECISIERPTLESLEQGLLNCLTVT
jgi:G3E family GTPase